MSTIGVAVDPGIHKNSCKENLLPLETKNYNKYPNACAVYTDNIPEAEDYERFHFNCVFEENLNKDLSTQQISNVNLDDDLHLSDDRIADPDYELPKKCNESNTDSEIEELSIPIITSAQVHVTLPSQDQDESLSIFSSVFEIDRFHRSSPVNNNPSKNNLSSPIDRIAVTNDETICEVLPVVSEDQIHTRKRKGRSRKKREECKRLRNSGQSYVTER
ncbi:unnamed protein product [Arctia plantaginis]|uniref:Uncharacterized protein n=1 Tax=Arctia plantaginis TaxID=874455 RepID=A0A8S0Z3Q4_ARCPL|nr:unnamed protein product [Arctia plantaginis]